ncbi:MAG: hypothetical protein J5506_04360 [Prevotella sp.]|nr:hypothetical protein [Prevotella sp.]
MKKVYIEPITKVKTAVIEAILQTASELDPNKGDQSVTPTEEEYEDEFGAKKFHSVWDEDE